ncbi:hypothetical protein HJC99_00395 [Candidatus Saccharibacteria bacterium]|nr:hypothetical protein [Candidatus Saccharibacteria bacterium]
MSTEGSFVDALRRLLTFDVAQTASWVDGTTRVQLTTRTSWIDRSYEVVFYHGSHDEVRIIAGLVRALNQLQSQSPYDFWQWLVTPTGEPLQVLPRRKLDTIADAVASAHTGRLIAVLQVLGLNFETVLAYTGFADFEEFLTIAVLAHELGEPFEDTRGQLVSA